MHYSFSEGYKPHLNGDYPIYTQTSFSDKITENTKEKGRREHMSFVGLTFFKDRIIGYGIHRDGTKSIGQSQCE